MKEEILSNRAEIAPKSTASRRKSRRKLIDLAGNSPMIRTANISAAGSYFPKQNRIFLASMISGEIVPFSKEAVCP
jgi:hypothetical protein